MHPRLEADTLPMLDIEAAKIRLMNDSRWLWLLLIPHDDTVRELHDLPDGLRQSFLEATSISSRVLQRLTACQSVNIGMLGNVVSQLHCHVIARNSGDTNWPGPVWGFGEAVPYAWNANQQHAINTLREQLRLSLNSV